MLPGHLSAESVVVLRYLTGASRPISAGRLCEGTGLPVTGVAAAIDELVATHLLRVADDASLVLLDRPSDPVPAPREEHRHDNPRWRHALSVAYDEDDPLVEAVVGMKPTVSRIDAFQVAGPREILSLSPPPTGPTSQPVNKSMVSLLRSGSTSIWITDESRVQHPVWRTLMQRHIGYGEQVYSVPVMQHRFLIFDRQVALIPLDPDNHAKGSLTVRSPALVHHLVTLFHEILGRATLVAADPTISETRRAVLTLLAGGAKDETIARRLNISTRTVRRVIASSMQEIGADSRFQLAVGAVRRGWLATDDLTRG